LMLLHITHFLNSASFFMHYIIDTVLTSFPARRSSDLYQMTVTVTTVGYSEIPHAFSYPQRMWLSMSIYLVVISWAYAIGVFFSRSEEHTSELQSRFDLVCRLLLEKKKYLRCINT